MQNENRRIPYAPPHLSALATEDVYFSRDKRSRLRLSADRRQIGAKDAPLARDGEGSGIRDAKFSALKSPSI